MKTYKFIVAAALILAPLCSQAQPAAGEGQRLTPQVMARLFPAGVLSPEYHADGSVTFRCQAANAKKVELDCQMFPQALPMSKDERGVWTITVTPGKPDIYPYAFVVDGTKIADPNNMFIFPNEGFKYSLADVRGAEPAIQDIRDVPHGKVSYRYYHSNTCGIERPLTVYTPAGYDPAGSERLPVLYLIHGMTDTYETWFKVGHVNNILDNLIAEGKAKRMIVVMPYANPYPEMMLQGLADRYDAMDTERVAREIIDDVRPFIEANYKVKTSARDRAVAGFSLGGRQALATGLGNPKEFQWVCAMAPAIFGEEYKTNFTNGTYAPVETVRKNYKLLWIGTGTSDFLIEPSRGLDAFLTENGVKHTFYTPDGGHTWMNCRDYLTRIAQLLFK
ncbi:MAG: esterase [Bacteroidales bacterium]|nr:esterase [Bacteroidales bacterium]